MKLNRLALLAFAFSLSAAAQAASYFGEADDYNLDTPLGKLTGKLSRDCTNYAANSCTVTVFLKDKPIYTGNRLLPVLQRAYSGDKRTGVNGVTRWVAKEHTVRELPRGRKLQQWWVFDFSGKTPHVARFEIPVGDEVMSVDWNDRRALIQSYRGLGFRYQNGKVGRAR